MEIGHKEDKGSKDPPKQLAGGSLFRKLQSTKSTLSSQTIHPPKKSISVQSIDSDNDEPKRDFTKRESFLNHLKSIESTPKQSLPIPPPPRGIKRFFHSEEEKRSKTIYIVCFAFFHKHAIL